MTTIRAYAPSDDDDIVAVWEAASRLAHPFLSDDFIASERKAIREVHLPNTKTFVAEDDGAVIGFIAMMGAEVGAIFLHPDHHGKGVGRSLMDKAAEDADALEVEVFEKNRIGRPFYERSGFREISRSVHEPTQERVIRMRWARGGSRPT